MSVQIPFLLYKNFIYSKYVTYNIFPIPLMLVETPAQDREKKSLLECSYFEFLGFSSHFQQFSNRVHKTLIVKVAHFLNFSVMIADASFKLLHESSMFLTIIDRP